MDVPALLRKVLVTSNVELTIPLAVPVEGLHLNLRDLMVCGKLDTKPKTGNAIQNRN